MKYKVKNVTGSSDDVPPKGYDSWIDYWEKRTYTKAVICHRDGCLETNELNGAHVTILDESPDKIYIVPLCNTHNNSNVVESFEVKEILVPVDVEDNFLRYEILDGIRMGTRYDVIRKNGLKG
jgi:hypothetical protein